MLTKIGKRVVGTATVILPLAGLLCAPQLFSSGAGIGTPSYRKGESLDETAIRADGKLSFRYDCKVASREEIACVKSVAPVPELFRRDVIHDEIASELLLRGSRNESRVVNLNGHSAEEAVLCPPRLVTGAGRGWMIAWTGVENGPRKAKQVSLFVKVFEEGSDVGEVRRLSNGKSVGVRSFDVASGRGNSYDFAWTDLGGSDFDLWPHPGIEEYERVFARALDGSFSLGDIVRVDRTARKRDNAYGVRTARCGDGTLWAVWDTRRKGSWRLVAAVRGVKGWQKETLITEQSQPHLFYSVTCSARGGISVAWSSSVGEPELFVTDVGGNGIERKERIADRACCPDSVLDSRGRLHVAYQSMYPFGEVGSTNDPTGMVYLQSRTVVGWGVQSAYADSAYLGTLQADIDSDDGLHLFWQEKSGEKSELVHRAVSPSRESSSNADETGG